MLVFLIWDFRIQRLILLFFSFVEGHTTIAFVYFNDIIIIGSQKEYITSLIQLLNRKFSLLDLGYAFLFRGGGEKDGRFFTFVSNQIH